MLSTTSVSDPGWAWGYTGEQDGSCTRGACSRRCQHPHTSLLSKLPSCASWESQMLRTLRLLHHNLSLASFSSLVGRFLGGRLLIPLVLGRRFACISSWGLSLPSLILMGSVSSIQLCSQRFPLSRVSTWHRAGLRKWWSDE